MSRAAAARVFLRLAEGGWSRSFRLLCARTRGWEYGHVCTASLGGFYSCTGSVRQQSVFEVLYCYNIGNIQVAKAPSLPFPRETAVWCCQTQSLFTQMIMYTAIIVPDQIKIIIKWTQLQFFLFLLNYIMKCFQPKVTTKYFHQATCVCCSPVRDQLWRLRICDHNVRQQL